MKNKEYKESKIGDMIQLLADRFGFDPLYARAVLAKHFPQLNDKNRCPNCNANMEMNVFTADVLQGILLINMAEAVRHAMTKGKPFTEANKVHVPTLPISHSIQCRTTIGSYLNFVKQPKEWSKSGHWLITGWGWKALCGEEVPKTAKYFRGELIERGQETTTLGDMFRTHRDKVENALARGKSVATDYRPDIRDYDPVKWTEFGGYGEGKLL